METKFTEGCWSKQPVKNGVIEIKNEYGILICEIDYVANIYNHTTPIGAHANASLISAAPYMFEQLVSIIDGTAFDKETGLILEHRLEEIRKVLNKAVVSDSF